MNGSLNLQTRRGTWRRFHLHLDNALRKLNVYYDDLIKGNILRILRIQPMRKGAFIDYMKSMGKLGGQNKVPRLSNDRKIADELINFTAEKLISGGTRL